MESPDRDPANSAAESQGSPIFDFLCTLSPIKPVRTAHLVQTFSEISFAPPPVFVSPKTEGRRGSISSKRNHTGNGGKDLKGGFVNCEIDDQSQERPILLNSLHKFGGLKKGNKQKDLHETSPSSSPSKLVEEYLAEPMEDGQTMEKPSNVPIRTDFPLVNTNEDNEMDSISRKDVKKLLDFDQGASELEYFMLEGEKLQQHARVNENQDNTQSLIALSTEQVEGYIASLREAVDDQTIGLSAEMQAGSTLTRTSFLEADTQKQGSVSSRVNMTLQRGLRRRCLDFEAVDSQTKSNPSLGLKSSDSVLLSESHYDQPKISISVLRERASVTSSVSNCESVNDLMDSCGNPSTDEEMMSDAKQQAARQIISNTSCLKNAEITPKRSNKQLGSICIKNSNTGAVMPSGIGLHLNSLTRSTTFPSRRGITVSAGSQTSGNSENEFKEAKTSRVQVRTLGIISSALDALEIPNKEQNDDTQDGTVVPCDNVKNNSCKAESEILDPSKPSRRPVTRVRSFTIGIKSLEDTEVLGKRPCPLGRKRVLLPDIPAHKSETEDEGTEEPSSTSPKKKKKPTSTVEKGDGCKRCNCKKSKCLKLYCECFAAGVYCVDSCSCQDCFNKPESEDIVMETRQQIESRNPLAFAPKIVHASDSTVNNAQEDGTPANSGRHKRGCNCKRSHCLKKYCECFQAGVGCSDGCRCENCKNSFGKKSGADDSEDQDQQIDILDKETTAEQNDSIEICENSSHGYNQPDQNLSPITPSLHNAGENRNILNMRSVNKRRLSSDDLPSPAFSLPNVNISRSPTRLLRPFKGKQKSTPSDSSGVPLPKIGASPVSTPRILKIGQFSPRWDGLDDICTVTPLAQAPSRPTPASTSIYDGSDSSPSANIHNCKKFSNNSKFTSALSSNQCETPSDHLNTPTTEIFSAITSNTDIKSCAMGSDSFFSQLLCGDDDDDDDGTPEFLKESEQRDLPVCLLNSTSPKHKRVSPPHIHAAREGFNRRGGRKFILQSVPTVPPFTGNPKMET